MCFKIGNFKNIKLKNLPTFFFFSKNNPYTFLSFVFFFFFDYFSDNHYKPKSPTIANLETQLVKKPRQDQPSFLHPNPNKQQHTLSQS